MRVRWDVAVTEVQIVPPRVPPRSACRFAGSSAARVTVRSMRLERTRLVRRCLRSCGHRGQRSHRCHAYTSGRTMWTSVRNLFSAEATSPTKRQEGRPETTCASLDGHAAEAAARDGQTARGDRGVGNACNRGFPLVLIGEARIGSAPHLPVGVIHHAAAHPVLQASSGATSLMTPTSLASTLMTRACGGSPGFAPGSILGGLRVVSKANQAGLFDLV